MVLQDAREDLQDLELDVLGQGAAVADSVEDFAETAARERA